MLNALTAGLGALAGIQYLGCDGVSATCHDAIQRLVQYRDRIETARIITCDHEHGLLLFIDGEGHVAVKSGFRSGYSGEGPKTFAAVLQLLEVAGASIDEYEVPDGLMRRLSASALTRADVELVEAANPIRPRRWHDYIPDRRLSREFAPQTLRRLRSVMPWSIVDEAIVDLALTFFDGPDKAILSAFRRLEDGLRKRTKLTEHGAKLCSQAFSGDESVLEWKNLDKGEQIGRAQLFTGAFQAFRNPRAHRELSGSEQDSLAEFLMVNQLFLLERQATKRPVLPKDDAPPTQGKTKTKKATGNPTET